MWLCPAASLPHPILSLGKRFFDHSLAYPVPQSGGTIRSSETTRIIAGNPPLIDDPVIKAQIKLVTHRLRGKKDIERVDDDITAPCPSQLRARFHVVRVANILNRDYFSSHQLGEIVGNLRDRLTGPGAFLLIVRTESKGNHGSIFRMDDRGSFEVLSRIGRGSEIEDIVLGI